MRRRALSGFIGLLATVGLASCGAPQPAPGPTPVAAAAPVAAPAVAPPESATPVALPTVVTPAAAAAVPTSPWAALDHMGRVRYMREVVVPALAPEFKKWNPKEFSELTCEACHGSGAKKGQFKMPNPALEKLPGTDEGFAKLAAKRPKVMAFMAEVVTPKMADLLGEPHYDHATGKGFGCGGCHTFKK